ncbi:MAG: DUF6551 family protein [Actinomycetes bacterium]
MTTNALESALADADELLAAPPVASEPETGDRPPPYVTALPAAALFADQGYQRPLDEYRVAKMAETFDATLLGVLEVSDRGDGSYAVIDGGHRLALVRDVIGPDAHLVCNVHRGLSVAEEARLFYQVDVARRALTGWDRWWARRGAGEPAVLDIEKVVEARGLRVAPSTKDGTLRATRACEHIVALGGLDLLDSTLTVALAAFGPVADAVDGTLIHGVALVLDEYAGEVDVTRLTEQLKTMPPRQVKARAALLREAHKGQLARLVAAVFVERYNAGPGRKVEDYLTRVKPQSRTKLHGSVERRNAAIRLWAKRTGYPLNARGDVTKAARSAYDAAHPQEQA